MNQRVLVTFQVQVERDMDLDDYELDDGYKPSTYEEACEIDIDQFEEGSISIDEVLGIGTCQDIAVTVSSVRVQEGGQ